MAPKAKPKCTPAAKKTIKAAKDLKVAQSKLIGQLKYTAKKEAAEGKATTMLEKYKALKSGEKGEMAKVFDEHGFAAALDWVREFHRESEEYKGEEHKTSERFFTQTLVSVRC
jgi:hypothetical protein